MSRGVGLKVLLCERNDRVGEREMDLWELLAYLSCTSHLFLLVQDAVQIVGLGNGRTRRRATTSHHNAYPGMFTYGAILCSVILHEGDWLYCLIRVS